MNLRVMLWCCCLLFAVGCSPRSDDQAGDLLAQLQETGSVRVGVKLDTPPFGFPLAGEPAGFDIDIITSVLARLGIDEVTMVPVTSANRMETLLDGEVDILIASMTITRSRDRLVDFSVPYFQDGQGLLVAADSDITGVADLPQRRVGVSAGSTSLHNVRQVAPQAEMVTVENFAELVQALADGRVEAITTDTTILIGLRRDLPGGADAWRLAGDAFSTEPYGIAMPKNQSNLRAAINDALMAMWEDGDYQMLYDSWFGAHTPYADHVQFGMTPYPQ
ncbi:MAG: amino acid ABC transporter substrate-binding protein [Planctomycetota bacterium]|nr:MAG: amino acid ABC transporter substrate-binding protein [Planctomycetota bacterium]